MDIKEIALKVAMDTGLYLDGANQSEPFYVVKPKEIVEFAEALIESYKAELLKEVGEPVARTVDRDWISTGEGTWLGRIESHLPLDELKSLYTSDQVAAAILKATKPLEDQLAKANQLWQIAQGRCDGLEEKLAKAEQRVAEACAYLAHQHMDADIAADAINNGEWRKFVKEV